MEADRTRGFRFKDGKLYAFTGRGVMVLDGWPALRAIRKDEGAPWTEFTPAFRVIRPYRPRARKQPSLQLELDLGVIPVAKAPPSLATQRRRAFDAFRFALPRPVAARAEKFQNRQWALLKLFQARKETLELAEQNPALCFALGNAGGFAERASLDQAVERSGQRQREIAGWLGFPATDGAVRILSRLAPESASVEQLCPLRAALARPEVMKALAHLPRLNAGVLALVLDPELLAASTPALLAEVAAAAPEKYRGAAASLLGDTLRMIRRVYPRRGTPRVQSQDRLRALHAEVSTQYLRLEALGLETTRLPAPPLPGTREIVPLRTVSDLVEEGEAQDNCVATYAARVQQRDVFIYRVLKPQRATLSIVRSPAGDWEVDQLETRSNGPASPLTHRLVAAWLDEHALSA